MKGQSFIAPFDIFYLKQKFHLFGRSNLLCLRVSVFIEKQLFLHNLWRRFSEIPLS